MTAEGSPVGLTTGPVIYDVERGAIRKLALAIGDATPVYARGDVAPPTFPTTFRSIRPPLPADLDLNRILYGGEEYEYCRPLRAGDRISLTRRLADVYERTGGGGRMTFYIVESEGRDEQGEVVYRSRSTLIYR